MALLAPRAFLVFPVLVLCGCASSEVSFNAYEGAARPDAELAVIAERNPKAALQVVRRGDAMVWQRKANYGEQAIKGNITTEQVKLPPGRYKIESLLWCASSYAYEMSGYASPNFPGVRHTDEVELIAGHTYEIRGENVGYLCHDGPKLWIEDATAGRRLETISSNEETFTR